jgi:hypothetical protein
VFLVGLLGAAVVVAVVGVTDATGFWGSLSGRTQAQLKQAVVRYELAKASMRPARMIGKKLTRADKAALQTRFLRRLDRYATGRARSEGDTWDYAAALLEDEWDARELVGVTGRIVYWDDAQKDLQGDVHVKAGVQERHKVVVWDAAANAADPAQDWVTGVIVYDYTLREVDGAWKVADSSWWRFYDPNTGELGTGP